MSRNLSYAETQILTRRLAGELREHDAGEDINEYMPFAAMLVSLFDEFLSEVDLSTEAPGGAFE